MGLVLWPPKTRCGPTDTQHRNPSQAALGQAALRLPAPRLHSSSSCDECEDDHRAIVACRLTLAQSPSASLDLIQPPLAATAPSPPPRCPVAWPRCPRAQPLALGLQLTINQLVPCVVCLECPTNQLYRIFFILMMVGGVDEATVDRRVNEAGDIFGSKAALP